MKIVFLDSATVGSDISLAPISSLGDSLFYDYTAASEVFERIADAEVVIVNKVVIGREQIDKAPKLKLICVAATGMNNIDLAYAAQKGIPVKNVKGYSTECVVQVTFMHILNLVGHGNYFDRRVKSGAYSSGKSFTDLTNPFQELSGKKLGIIGLGTIGRRVAEIASAFGMKVSYFSTSGTKREERYPALSLEDILRESDIVSIHAPLNDKTLNLICYDQIKIMKPSAFIINMGRGGIVNETHLARALDENLIAGAAIDVFCQEPLSADSPLMAIKESSKIIFSPHIGWASVEARKRLVDMIAKNIREVL